MAGEKIQARQDRLEAEISRIIQGARRRAEQQADQVLEAARVQSERMGADAKRTIENELASARARLRAEMVARTLAHAQKDVAGRLDEAGQRALVERFLSDMEGMP